MKITETPTGFIGILQGDHGPIECLAVADYGKEKNIKADFLGLHKDVGEVTGTPNPMSEKMVVTISTQYGCASHCRFCDVPAVGDGRNATLRDLRRQVAGMIIQSGVTHTQRLNIHYARMGEPTWNMHVLNHAYEVCCEVNRIMSFEVLHPVVSTMLPRGNKGIKHFLLNWCDVKNRAFCGDAGLQLSINSTNDEYRDWLFGNSSLSLNKIATLADSLPAPKGRKYTLNFIVGPKADISGWALKQWFDPSRFLVKLTPVHSTRTAQTHGIYGDFWYSDIEKDCKDNGFDVIVFVPSEDEERGRITCGNAILSDKRKGQA